MTDNAGKLIRRLIKGQFSTWHGLQPFSSLKPPEFLIYTGQSGWLGFPHGPLAYRIFHDNVSDGEVWFFSDKDGGDVCLIEVYRLPLTQSVAQLLNELGTPDLESPVPLAARLQRGTHLDGSDLIERVYSKRGIAIVTRTGADGQLELVRVRGFKTMPYTQYQERFVNLPSTRIMEQQ